MKRIFCCVMSFFFVVVSCVHAVSVAAVGYDISYWYSDVDEVYVWANKNIDVYVQTNVTSSSLTVAKLKNYLSTALSSWSCTGISTNEVSNKSSADLILGAITRAQATNLGVPTNVAGVTSVTKSEQVATLYYGTVEKRLYNVTRAIVYLIASDPTSTTTGARKIAVHELGHAFGYWGHYANGAVMTSYYENMTSTTPNTAEKNHLKQVK